MTLKGAKRAKMLTLIKKKQEIKNVTFLGTYLLFINIETFNITFIDSLYYKTKVLL